jgi:arginine-tRNA-protein transferase
MATGKAVESNCIKIILYKGKFFCPLQSLRLFFGYAYLVVMFSVLRLPGIRGPLLDLFLSQGWYRYGGAIFTTDHIETEGLSTPVIWIRYQVDQIKISKSSEGIIKKWNGFSVRVKPFQYNEELESLHQRYLASVKFEVAQSLPDLLEDLHGWIYETQMIEVRDQNKLIAVGIFDLGEQSIAGIKNFFCPDYRAYSPGKMLMLLKYHYCLENKIPLYYPGYIAPGNPRFDYKLFLDKSATEQFVFESTTWIPM